MHALVPVSTCPPGLGDEYLGSASQAAAHPTVWPIPALSTLPYFTLDMRDSLSSGFPQPTRDPDCCHAYGSRVRVQVSFW